nr:unnamed protein product [Callosobruchus chinensis]
MELCHITKTYVSYFPQKRNSSTLLQTKDQTKDYLEEWVKNNSRLVLNQQQLLPGCQKNSNCFRLSFISRSSNCFCF